MPLFLKKLVSFEDFNGNFNNIGQVHKTLACFNLGNETPLWKHWGFAYNNPNSDHAEQIILQELYTFLGLDQSNISLKYKLNLYTSYSPCFSCCKDLCSFLDTYKNQVSMHLKIAKLYKFYDSNNQRGLQMLRENGADITIMDLEDYKECFYLFVSPTDTFQPCPDLNHYSYGNARDMDLLWNEDESRSKITIHKSEICHCKGSSGGNESSSVFAATEFSTPESKKDNNEARKITPEKLHIAHGCKGHKGVKRKLSF
ncbi:DNA dC-_dU-editing enzyme APOBEC-3A isoform X1 [Xenopus laevis]|uniref:DNA dC->dU-editing enzyme APOBEC-3A isoform X1 n=3 Tax=Xenopus laevis TaxID=8355 RepID=A0A1L8H937_XENLA|nr:DNA dC->dU-editing enzyme APOBEC-3A isoform X1 [Xenopus laevis]OCT92600.1 hypothetical protein XELAEV_18015657mg [Xenopus laevis]